MLLRPMTAKVMPSTYRSKRGLIDEVEKNPLIMERIQENVYANEGILAELEYLNEMDQTSDEYRTLYQKVIQVGEFPN
jgi:hypothetical protein